MVIRLLRYSVLILILWYLPSFLLNYLGGTFGSLASYATSLSLIAYFVLNKDKRKPLLSFIALGFLYFVISGLNYTEVDVDNYFIKEFVRFMIVVICGAAVLHDTNDKEIYYILLIGGASIIINAVFFPFMQAQRFAETYGRFSGFYLNPNLAGSICLLGYALTFAVKNTKWKIIGQIVFTLGGILTFSRTFLVIWLALSIITIYNNKKNLIAPILGALALIMVFAFSNKLTLSTERFGALQSVFGQGTRGTKVMGKDTRNDTWANYYDLIFDKPYFGHGFRKFSKKGVGLPGVHNSYLLVIGEAGIFPFLLLLGIYSYLIIMSYTFIKSHPWYFYMVFVIMLSMMGNHSYFYNFVAVLLSMYVFIRLRELASMENLTINNVNTINH